MVELSESARKGLDDYLHQVRSYLRWSKSLDRDEVEQNITEHIERELEETPQPVSASALEGVLARLGSPRQWVPPEALNWWGKLIVKLPDDATDWRPAYVSFGFLLFGCIWAFFSPAWLVLFPAAFIVARAALDAAGSDKELGARRWLLYPSLLVIDIPLALTLLTGPGFLAGAIGAELYELSWVRQASHMGLVALVITSATLVTSAWWIILGLVLCKWPSLVRHTFHPFANRFNRRRALAIAGAGLLLLLLLAGFVALYMNGAFEVFME
jgi:hypothetical protein